MQTKHLHLLLLIMLMAGCGPRSLRVQQKYVSDNEGINLKIPESSGAELLSFGNRASALHGIAPSIRVKLGDPASSSLWECQWCSASGDPIEMPRRTVIRSLLALHLSDTTAALAQTVVPLPDGGGFAFYLDGWSAESATFALSAKGDSQSFGPPRRAGKVTLVFQCDDRAVLAVASRELAGFTCGEDDGWNLTLRATRARQVILASGLTDAEACRKAEKWLGTTANELEVAAKRALDKRLAFRLQTEDDRANQAFALLSAALVGGAQVPPGDSSAEIERYAGMTAGLWLASRQTPAYVFEPDAHSTLRDARFRRGSAAWRAALAYGMAGEDSLQDRIRCDALALLTRLESELAVSGVTVVADKSVADSLMREAMACVRLASLFNLGEEIVRAAHDNEAQADFRRRSLSAARGARERFNESARQARLNELARLQARDTPMTELSNAVQEESLSDQVPACPDTLLYLSAGARLGFGWLESNPESLYNPRLPVSGLVWQRWLAWRFAHDPALTETSDLDSLCALLLEGPVPGFLSDASGFDGSASLEVMAAAFQNLSEVYLGVQPNALANSVTIEPRLPSSWGRTKACVPFGTGSLFLDYNLAESDALVGMDGRDTPLDVLFAYPLPGGTGFLRAQFTLEPGKHPMRVSLERDQENRYRLKVLEVP